MQLRLNLGSRRRVSPSPRWRSPSGHLLVEQQFLVSRFVLVIVRGGSANLSGTLNASGSTLQLVYQQAAIAAFKSVQSHHGQLRRRRLGQGVART